MLDQYIFIILILLAVSALAYYYHKICQSNADREPASGDLNNKCLIKLLSILHSSNNEKIVIGDIIKEIEHFFPINAALYYKYSLVDNAKSEELFLPSHKSRFFNEFDLNDFYPRDPDAFNNIFSKIHLVKLNKFFDSYKFSEKYYITPVLYQSQLIGCMVLIVDKSIKLSKEEKNSLEIIANMLGFLYPMHQSLKFKEAIHHTQSYQLKAENLTKALEKERNNLAMQEDFLSIASHEFRTPMAIISATTQLIQRKFNDLDLERKNFLEKQIMKIMRAIDRFSTLIDNSLNLTKMEQGELTYRPEYMDIAGILRDLITQQQDMDPQRKFIVHLDDMPAQFYGDAKIIEQIFNNLISNAVKYSPANKEVAIESTQEDAVLIITIRDHGIGIPVDERNKLFQKFFRAKNTFGTAGTGIGLYLTKYLLNLHEGSIELNPKFNAGSEFIIKLPLKTV